MDIQIETSASVTLTEKFEILTLKESLRSEVKGTSKSDLKVSFKIEIGSKLRNLVRMVILKSNCKGKCEIDFNITFYN